MCWNHQHENGSDKESKAVENKWQHNGGGVKESTEWRTNKVLDDRLGNVETRIGLFEILLLKNDGNQRLCSCIGCHLTRTDDKCGQKKPVDRDRICRDCEGNKTGGDKPHRIGKSNQEALI